MRISDWSSDVCSSDLVGEDDIDASRDLAARLRRRHHRQRLPDAGRDGAYHDHVAVEGELGMFDPRLVPALVDHVAGEAESLAKEINGGMGVAIGEAGDDGGIDGHAFLPSRSEEHTSELQSLMRISYAVFCLK